jgi:hypothetical protein
MFASTAPRHPEADLCAVFRGHHGRPRVLVPMVFLMAGMLIAGCGSGAFRGPSVEHRQPGSASARPPGGTAAGRGPVRSQEASPAPAAARQVTYGYHLPYGDTGYAQDDEIIYGMLLAGRCADAQGQLNRSWFRLGVGGPREVLMMQVAIEMCRKNDQEARHFFNIAETRYGWAGLGLPQDIWSRNIYRAVESFWRQIPQNSPELTFPGGKIPPWPGGGYFPSQPVRACEDPRFGTGKCAGPAPSVTPATPAPSSPSTPAESGSPTPAASPSISSSSGTGTS